MIDVEDGQFRHNYVHAPRTGDGQVALGLDLGIAVLVRVLLQNHNTRFLRIGHEIHCTAHACARESHVRWVVKMLARWNY